MRSVPGILFVLVQFACVGFLLWTGPLIASPWPLLLLEVAGGALAAWAIGTMGLGNVRATPEPAEGAGLVERGPYRVLRHPMYTALLLATASLVATRFTLGRLAVAILLLLDLLAKSSYEERLLTAHFPGYAAYRARTWRMIPFLY